MTSSTTDQVLARAPHRHRHRFRHLVEEQQVQLHCLHIVGQHTCDLFDVFRITCRVYFARGSLQKFHCQYNFTGVPGVLRSETPYWVAFWPRLATDRGGLGRCRRSATALRRTLAHHRHRHQRLPSGISPAIHRHSGTLYRNKLSKQFLYFSQETSLSAEIMGMLTGVISVSRGGTLLTHIGSPSNTTIRI